MKKNFKYIVVALAAILACSCNNYLDIVPDNVATLDHAFNTRQTAKQYLFTCYSYLPDIQSPAYNPGFFGGDESVCYTNCRSNRSVHAWYIQRGQQSPSGSRCNYWQGSNGGKDLYQGIRDCNIFIENIGRVPDIEKWEADQWIAEAQFLKAYYHFYLTRMYGPIPIKDVNLPIDAEIDEVRVYRNSLDECFDYIVGLLDKILAEGNLPDEVAEEAQEKGRITNGIVKAVKAEVLMYAASPLFCGNSDYTGFTDNRGVEIFCPQKTDAERQERWQKAADACAEAIEFLEGLGYGLYQYENKNYTKPTNYKLAIRGALTENWNPECIWGYTRTRTTILQVESAPRALYATGGSVGNNSVTMQLASMFYTKNGVPIDEDITWDYANRFEPRVATADEGALISPGYTTASFNFDREYRFYADLGFDGGVYEGKGNFDENNPMVIQAKKGQPHYMITLNDWNMTGYWTKKLMDVGTVCSNTSWTYPNSGYPFPFIRMSGLYLYYAEALNESGADYESVLPWINPIRERAGVPDVATAWDTYTRSPGKYKTQAGMRDIIHRERAIELALEGQRFWDLRRWKEAYTALNRPITGWNTLGDGYDEYYAETLVFKMNFDVKDYFWPIPNQEIWANPNTLQNYGW